MWWKYGFFCSFFEFFSITESDEFGSILSSWVEEVLNCKVDTTEVWYINNSSKVEEVLNCKVTTTRDYFSLKIEKVEEVLNCKVDTTEPRKAFFLFAVEEVLKHKSERLGHPPVSENVVINNTEK